MGTNIRNAVLILLLGLLLVGCVAGGAVVIWAREQGLNPVRAVQLRINLARHDEELNTPAGTNPHYETFTVAQGEAVLTIASNLQAAGLINNPDLFMDYVLYHGIDSQLQAGTYYLQQTQTIPEIAYALTDASRATIPFLVLEGWRLEEIEAVIDSNPLLDFSGADFHAVVGPGADIPANFKTRVGMPNVLKNGAPPSLEGFLYPARYELRPGITPIELRDAMLEAFNARVTSEMYQMAAQQGLTMYEVVTLASIVEREAVVDDEKPIIASVYLNRLRLPMNLDADPTVQYAMGTPGDWWPSITQADYYGLTGVPNQSYSTYLNDGLPPGPIAAPSLSSIMAVLEPAQTEYFYFRADCDNQRHVFFLLNQQGDHAAFTCP